MASTLHDSPATARAAHLRRGINISHWFAQVYRAEGYTPQHFDSYFTAADIALIAAMGFDHIRFTLAPEPILAGAAGGEWPAAYLARIATAVRTMLDHDLAVILDIHPEPPFKKRLAVQDEAVAEFVAFWTAFASHFSRFDPERVFFEVLNEPEMPDPKRWNRVQNEAAAAIRRVAPGHTIIVSGTEYSQLAMLPFLEPPDDRNIIGNFHLYDPIAFTHQGAGWSPPWAMSCKGLTYPADAAFVAEFAKNVADPAAREELAKYAQLSWNVGRYDAMAAEAAAWGKRHGVAMTCNEFGVYRVFAPRSSRLAWLRDVAGALARHGVGWTMWDYAGDFAVTQGRAGERVADVEVLAALGLSAVAAKS